MALSRGQLESLWVQAGGPRGSARTAAAVALAESGGNVGSAGDVGLGGKGATSFGLWQVHTPAHPQYDARRLASDALYNARAAVAISEGGKSFAPWTTYKTGAYRPFLSAAAGPSGGSGALSPPSGAGAAQTASSGTDAETLERIGQLERELRGATVPVAGPQVSLPNNLLSATIAQGVTPQKPDTSLLAAVQQLRAGLSAGEQGGDGATATAPRASRSRGPTQGGGRSGLGLTRAQATGPKAPAPSAVKVRITPPKTPEERTLLQRQERFRGGLPGGY